MTMKLHILKVLYGLESHAKDGRCGLSRNGDIRRFVGKLVEKQTLVLIFTLFIDIFRFFFLDQSNMEFVLVERIKTSTWDHGSVAAWCLTYC